MDLINRQDVLSICRKTIWNGADDYYPISASRIAVRTARTETCEGCKHRGQWENELEYGASCPCLVCKRRVSDNYERSD